MTNTPNTPDKLLRIADVLQLVGFSRSKLWEDVSAGRFPAPIATGERSRRWLSSEVRAWQDERRAERDAGLVKPDPVQSRNGARARSVANAAREYRGPGRPRKHPAPPAAA